MRVCHGLARYNEHALVGEFTPLGLLSRRCYTMTADRQVSVMSLSANHLMDSFGSHGQIARLQIIAGLCDGGGG